jgi:mannose-6-phosphate isomerase-like protein (cupin superfamily)
MRTVGKGVLVLAAALGLTLAGNAQVVHEKLASRIHHTDLDNVVAGHSHGSTGFRKCQQIIPVDSMDVNLYWVNRCQMMPGGGVAEHFHNTVEEMFTILNGSAEFTIDGRTSLVKGPAGAPQRMGHSHAVYNPTNEPVDYMNFDVTYTKGHYDAFNLADSRDKVTQKDEIPQFMVMHLDKALLKPEEHYHGGVGTVQYRRALDSDVFLTNWAYMDHEVIPPGASDGLHRHMGVEEVYYVMDGSATFQLNDESAPIHKGDAIAVKFNEAHAIINNGTEPIELLIEGVSAQKNVIDTELGAAPRFGTR